MRDELAKFVGKEFLCTGKIERYVRAGGNGERCVVLTDVVICGFATFDHMWLRKGIPSYLFTTFYPDDTIEFRATIWRYKHVNSGEEGYSLAFPKQIIKRRVYT